MLRDTHEKNPEIFADFRVKNLMVKALGDSYADLADMAAGWLKEEGPKINPLLKLGFDPEEAGHGQESGAYIIHIRGDENDFYAEMLPKASKEVKEALVHALRHRQDNEKLLLDLVKSEKGKVKEAALTSLAHMNGEGAVDFWKKQMDKNPAKAINYLQNSRTTWASDLMALHLEQWLDGFEASGLTLKRLKNEDRQRLYDLWRGAQVKCSPRMCACYRRVYRIIPRRRRRIFGALLRKNSLRACAGRRKNCTGITGTIFFSPCSGSIC